MCGINGILALADSAEPVSKEELLRTREYMASRGPDAAGEWFSLNGRIGLGHRRLAIIDLSASAQQPMSWANGRYWIVFNGEIYNYQELKKGLEKDGFTFQTHSDTEVVLALYAHFGSEMLTQLRGMFALAIWDETHKSLLLARDPFGIKPLYYSLDGNYLRFASQVKALEAGGGISMAPSAAGVVSFLLWGSVSEPHTIRQAVRALPAGHYLAIERGRVGTPSKYHTSEITPEISSASVADAVRDSVKAHLVSDVPIAVFLSAGLDSALLASLASQFLPDTLTTITVRFNTFINTPWDEGPLAERIASQLGTRHIERTIGVDDFPNLWCDVLQAMDQPSIDGFNTYIVSRIAHDMHFKVVLSGLGGDELFGGYGSFHQVPQLVDWGGRLGAVPMLQRWGPWLAKKIRPGQPKLTGLVKYARDLPGAYYLWRGLYLPEELPSLIGDDCAKEGLSAYNPIIDVARHLQTGSSLNPGCSWGEVQAMETGQYMRNQLLRDADWASMANSLELRVPLVDPRLAATMAFHHHEPARTHGKVAIVRAIAPKLPPTIWERPKSGFFIPVTDWLPAPQRSSLSRSWGGDSRQIAMRVLKEFLPGTTT